MSNIHLYFPSIFNPLSYTTQFTSYGLSIKTPSVLFTIKNLTITPAVAGLSHALKIYVMKSSVKIQLCRVKVIG